MSLSVTIEEITDFSRFNCFIRHRGGQWMLAVKHPAGYYTDYNGAKIIPGDEQKDATAEEIDAHVREGRANGMVFIRRVR